MPTPLISVPAGRSHRRAGTKFVDADQDKGWVQLQVEDDDLMHFVWKNRSTGRVEEDFIIFPGEATFSPLAQDTTKRTHILKFSSSDQKHFFWWQEEAWSGDGRNSTDINELLQDHEYQLGSAPIPPHPSAAPNEVKAEPATGSTTASGSLSSSWGVIPQPEADSSDAPPTTEETMNVDENSSSQMANMLAQWVQTNMQKRDSGIQLADVLSPQHIPELLRCVPSLIPKLVSLLPEGLNLPPNPTADDLVPILTAPQFSEAIRSLDRALRSGGLPGSMMKDVGLDESAGQGVDEFLAAIKGSGSSGSVGEQGGGGQQDDRMEQD